LKPGSAVVIELQRLAVPMNGQCSGSFNLLISEHSLTHSFYGTSIKAPVKNGRQTNSASARTTPQLHRRRMGRERSGETFENHQSGR
jgi:hypothetical protein